MHSNREPVTCPYHTYHRTYSPSYTYLDYIRHRSSEQSRHRTTSHLRNFTQTNRNITFAQPNFQNPINQNQANHNFQTNPSNNMGNICNINRNTELATFDYKFATHTRKLSELHEQSKKCLKNLFDATKVELSHRLRYGATESAEGYQAMREKAKGIEMEYERLIEKQREVLWQAQKTFHEEVSVIQARQEMDEGLRGGARAALMPPPNEVGRVTQVQLNNRLRGNNNYQIQQSEQQINSRQRLNDEQQQQFNPRDRLNEQQRQNLQEFNQRSEAFRSPSNDDAFSFGGHSSTKATTNQRDEVINSSPENSQSRTSRSRAADSRLQRIGRLELSEIQSEANGEDDEERKIQPIQNAQNNSMQQNNINLEADAQPQQQPTAACILYKCGNGEHSCPLRFRQNNEEQTRPPWKY